ncbi:retrovirus-related pol polyprotein from transposon TNT 1-94 [Tanacetum coccineum]
MTPKKQRQSAVDSGLTRPWFYSLIPTNSSISDSLNLVPLSDLHILILDVLNTLRYVGKDGREIFGMPIPDALLTDEIKGAPCFSGYLEHVADYQCYLDEEHNKVEEEEAENPDEPSPTKRSKGGLVGKRRNPKSPPRLVDEPSNEGVPVEEPAYNEEEVNIQLALELSLPNQGERTQGPARPVVIMEPNSGRLQPLPEVQGKGKDKVVEEQATHDLLTLQTPKKKSPAD